MYLGICILKNDIHYYSKPFILNIDKENNSFTAQLIRDIDYSLILLKDENIVLEIIVYPNSKSYVEANIKNLQSNIFKKLGTYNIIIKNIKEYKFANFKKGKFEKILDIYNNLNIEFNTIKREEKDEYIFSIPYISGKIDFLNNYLK